MNLLPSDLEKIIYSYKLELESIPIKIIQEIIDQYLNPADGTSIWLITTLNTLSKVPNLFYVKGKRIKIAKDYLTEDQLVKTLKVLYKNFLPNLNITISTINNLLNSMV